MKKNIKYRYNTVLDRGLKIIVKEPDPLEEFFKVIDYRTISFHADTLSVYSLRNISTLLNAAIYNRLFPMTASN